MFCLKCCVFCCCYLIHDLLWKMDTKVYRKISRGKISTITEKSMLIFFLVCIIFYIIKCFPNPEVCPDSSHFWADAVWQMRQKDRNPTLWSKRLGRRIIILNPFKCQTGFRTLCLFCQTICSNLISIIEPDQHFLFLSFFCLFQSVYLK